MSSSPPKPTVVLVHGAWADSSSWDGVVARLQRDGYPVDVFPTPLRSLAGDSDYLRAYLGAISGPIVLVGHSYGGAVITDAATGIANVKELVYVDAFALDLSLLQAIHEAVQHRQPVELTTHQAANTSNTFDASMIDAIVLEVPLTDDELYPGRNVTVWSTGGHSGRRSRAGG